MKTTLIIMAAGIGSRFGGGIKQLAQMGPSGEVIMDYSIYDAKKAGFNKVVFVIRKDIEAEFKEVIGKRIEEQMEVAYVYQELTNIPEGFSVLENRTKPWGTGQAILSCRGVVKEPFVIINADDYYGKEAFRALHEFLVAGDVGGNKYRIGMAGFVLQNTLSRHGAVTRGICVADKYGMLAHVIETSGIRQEESGEIVCDNEAVQEWIIPEDKVSMNMWAGYPDLLDCIGFQFADFLKDEKGDPCKKEFLIPEIIDRLLRSGQASVKVLKTDDRWIGITYKEGLITAQEGFRQMVRDGLYPEKLWN